MAATEAVWARLRRVPGVVWVALTASLLLLPGLGSFGLWDPWELRLIDPGGAGAGVAVAPASVAVRSLGAALGEAGARTMFALSAVAAALAVYWAGVGLFGRRAALIAAAVLLGLPLFTLQGRQLTSDMPLVLALALALGGLGRFAWRRDGRVRVVDLAVGVAGLALGFFAGGALIGVLLPCLALLVARFVAPAGSAPRTFFAGVAAVAAVVLGLIVFRPHTAGVYSALLGGIPRAGAPTHTFEALLRQTGFGLFPWTALAFFALLRPLSLLPSEPHDGSPPREAGSSTGESAAAASMFLLFFAGLGLALSTVRLYLVGDIRFPVLAPIALAVGVFLDDALTVERPQPVVAFLVALGTMVVARDLYLAPEELASLHTLEKLKWPAGVAAAKVFFATGIVSALALLAALGVRRPLVRRLGGWGSAAVGVAFAAFLAHRLVPELSQHLSLKTVLASYRQVAREGEVLGQYRVDSRDPQLSRMPALQSPELLASFLARQRPRGFALVAASELAAVDAALRLAHVPYLVLDASSSRVLLLASQPRPGEQDRSPLRASVWNAPSPPELAGRPLPVWPTQRPDWPPPRVPLSAVFGEAIELIGADYPPEVRRGRGLPLTLHFRVLRRPPPGFNVFVHLELPGQPITNGDHEPVGGIFPTGYWLPGQYILDRYTIELPRALTSAGTYRMSMGLWPGGNRERLPVTAGQNDGHDRVPLGAVEVR